MKNLASLNALLLLTLSATIAVQAADQHVQHTVNAEQVDAKLAGGNSTQPLILESTSNSTMPLSLNATSPHDFSVGEEEVDGIVREAFATALQLSIASTLDEYGMRSSEDRPRLPHVSEGEIASIKRCIGPATLRHLHVCIIDDLHAASFDPNHIPGEVVKTCIWREEFERLGACFEWAHDRRIEQDERVDDRLSDEDVVRLVDEHEEGNLVRQERHHGGAPHHHSHHYYPKSSRDNKEMNSFVNLLEHNQEHYDTHHHHIHAFRNSPSHEHALAIPEEKDQAPRLVKRRFGYGPDWETQQGVRRGHPLP